MGCYYHQCFLRDLPGLTCLIRRTTTNEGRLKPNIDSEPNLYRIRNPSPPTLRKSSTSEPNLNRISNENPLPPTLRKSSTHLIVLHNGEDAATPSSSEDDSKKRTISLDDSSDTTKLVQHDVLSTSSFMPENYQAHEFSAARPEDMAVPALEIQQDGYPHLYPYYFHRGFPYQYHPPPMMFSPYASDPQQGHWIPQFQPGFNCHAASFPDNGTTVQQGGYVMKNDQGWTRTSPEDSLFTANFIADPSSGIIGGCNNNY